MPEDAVLGGNDSDGAPMYVGRAFHNGDMLVAKVLPSQHIAFVSWRGEELPKDHFEVLCGRTLVWQHCNGKAVPENAVQVGRTALDQPVYVGRGYYEGSLCVGKVSSVHRALFIPFRGAERRLVTYEILVEERKPFGWDIPPSPTAWEKPNSPTAPDDKPPMYSPPYPSTVPPSTAAPPFQSPPPYVLPATTYSPPPPPYVLPATTYSPPSPPHVVPATTYRPPSPPYVVPATTYRPPSPPSPPPPPPPHHHFHPPPPPPHHHSHPPPPPPHHHCYPQQQHYDMWMAASGGNIPPHALHAGHDTDLSTILLCRAFHEGEMLPGKFIPNRGCAYISYAGQELPKTQFEVLVGDTQYHWVPASNGSVPPGAVTAGCTRSGEPLYVGRAHYSGSLTPGKVHQSHQCLYIAFGGCERRVSDYEVLVRRNDFYHDQAAKMLY